MYRPQFVYEGTSGKCDAQRCHYSFDKTNTPALDGVPAAGVLSKIPLQMDQDAAFFLRAITVNGAGLLIRLEDCFDNPLSTDGEVLDPSLTYQSNGGPLAPQESDNWGVFCPAGGTLLLYASNPTADSVTDAIINLHGIKLYQEGVCS